MANWHTLNRHVAQYWREQHRTELKNKLSVLIQQDDLSYLTEKDSPLSDPLFYSNQELSQYFPALLQKQISFSINKYENNPLRLALAYGSLDSVLLLLNAKANPNTILTRSFGTTTCLIDTIDRGKKEKIALLLKVGANPNVVTEGLSTTPLMSAIGDGYESLVLDENRLAIVDMLLRAGGNPMLCNEQHEHALMIMKKHFFNLEKFGNPAKRSPEEYKKIARAFVHYYFLKRMLGAELNLRDKLDEEKCKLIPMRLPQEIVAYMLRFVDFGLVK